MVCECWVLLAGLRYTYKQYLPHLVNLVGTNGGDLRPKPSPPKKYVNSKSPQTFKQFF